MGDLENEFIKVSLKSGVRDTFSRGRVQARGDRFRACTHTVTMSYSFLLSEFQNLTKTHKPLNPQDAAKPCEVRR